MQQFARAADLQLTFVVVASGPSFSVEQAQYIEQMRAADRCRVIAINDNYRRLPHADILYASDQPWWDKHVESVFGVYHFKGECWTCCPVTAARYGLRHIDHYNGRGLSLNPSIIHTGGNSGYAGMNLAFHKLPRWPSFKRRIIAVGFDFQQTGGQAHWFGDHPKGLSRTHPFKSWLERFPPLVSDLRHEGVEVINCTIDTALTCMPRATLQDILK